MSLFSYHSNFYELLSITPPLNMKELNYNHLKLDNFSSFSSDLGPEDRRRRSLVLEGKESTKFNTTQFQGSSHTRAHFVQERGSESTWLIAIILNLIIPPPSNLIVETMLEGEERSMGPTKRIMMRRNRTLCSSGSDLIWTLNYFPLLFLNFLEMPLSGTQMRAIVIAIVVGVINP
ncbi:hypothetical protein ACET3Z_031483 [Daucus carota]